MLENILVPIFVAVVLPVAIVLITALTKMNNDNKRTQVLLKAIETNNNIDADKLAEAFNSSRKQRTALELLNLRLLRGCICAFIGLVLIIVGVCSLLSGIAFSHDSVTLPILFGGATLAVGISYLTVYFVTRKQITNDKK